MEQCKELLNIALTTAKAEKMSNPEYNSGEFLDNLIKKEVPESIINGDIVTIKKYEFTIDRENLTIGASEILEDDSNTGFKNTATILGGIGNISQNGYSQIIPQTENDTNNYNIHTIIYNGNLILDGNNTFENVEGITYIAEDNSYEIGSKDDVAKEITKEDGTKEIVDASSTVVLKVTGNIQINNGVTLTACKSDVGYGGPKGLVIYCTGTITNNGKISMTARGARAQGEDVYLWQNKDGSYEYIPAVGAKGADSEYHNGNNTVKSGKNGENGYLRQTGGGSSR